MSSETDVHLNPFSLKLFSNWTFSTDRPRINNLATYFLLNPTLQVFVVSFGVFEHTTTWMVKMLRRFHHVYHYFYLVFRLRPLWIKTSELRCWDKNWCASFNAKKNVFCNALLNTSKATRKHVSSEKRHNKKYNHAHLHIVPNYKLLENCEVLSLIWNLGSRWAGNIAFYQEKIENYYYYYGRGGWRFDITGLLAPRLTAG